MAVDPSQMMGGAQPPMGAPAGVPGGAPGAGAPMDPLALAMALKAAQGAKKASPRHHHAKAKGRKVK